MNEHVSVRRLALGVLLAGFEGTAATGAPHWLLGLLGQGLAGVTIFGRNITQPHPVEDLAELAGVLRLGRPDLLVAIDEEGGDVTRLDAGTGSMFLGQGSLGLVDDVTATRRASALLGARLAAAGVNLNFAPVADVASERQSPIIGSRSFSDESARVARHVAGAVAGHLESGIAPTAKHFPGHGGTSEDSHLVVPIVDVGVETLWERELPPFIAAIAAGVPCIMTAHVKFAALDPDHPATLSYPILTTVLRERLGFDGVVVTDGLDMHAMSRTIGRPEAVVQALIAGADLMCIGGDSVTPEVVEGIVAAVVDAVKEGRLGLPRLAEANARVAVLADRFAHERPRSVAPSEGPMTGVAASSLRVVGRPQLLDGRATVVEFQSDPSIVAGEVAFGMGRPLQARIPETRVIALRRGMPVPELDGGDVVVSVRDCHLHPWQADVVALLRRKHPQLVIVDHGGSAPEEVLGSRAIVARDASSIAAIAAADLLLETTVARVGGH